MLGGVIRGDSVTAMCGPFVELPGIEPISECWSLRCTAEEQRNYIRCNSRELNSMDSNCAQNVPNPVHDWQRACIRLN